MKTIIVLLLVFAYFYKKNKDFGGLQVIIFTIPFFFTYVPTSGYWQSFPISITGILVILLFILSYSRSKSIANNVYFKTTYIILIFNLIWGLLFAFIYYEDAENMKSYMGYMTSQLGLLKPTVQVIYHSSNLLLCILFLKLLKKQFEINRNLKKYAYVFSLTIIPMFLTQLFEIVMNYDISARGEATTQLDYIYAGLFYGFGFGMYISIIVAFTLFYKFKHYRLILISALLYGLFSGERQAILFPIIVLSVFYLSKKGKVIFKLASILGFVIVLFLLVYFFKSKFIGIERTMDTYQLTKYYSILELTGRGGGGQIMNFFKDAIFSWPLTGKGSYNWGHFKGIDSLFGSHTLWLNYYQKYGLIGSTLFIAPLIYFIFTMAQRFIVQKDKLLPGIVLSLLVSFFVQQFLDNPMWFTNTMLLYVFMFSCLFSLIGNEESKTNKNNVSK